MSADRSVVSKLGIKKILFRAALCFITFAAFILVGLYAAVSMVHFGPSKAARSLFTATVMETSGVQFLARWFLTQEIIDEIIGDTNAVIHVPPTKSDTVRIGSPAETNDISDTEITGAAGEEPFDINAVEIVDIKGRTYTGKLMIVNDPARVSIGVPSNGYGTDKQGVTTLNMVKNSGSLGGVNGGGFDDYNGHGNGGVPIGRRESGIVIKGGKLLWGSLTDKYEIIGLTGEGLLILGTMTGQEALDMGIAEALNFGPYLILDGEAYGVDGESESGLNPRTAIGQREDGAILLLVINGRQSNSLGATLEDLVDIMMQYGAVNAANLDGGSSSYMVYEDEIITTCASLYGPRKMATSILVSRAEGE